MEIIPQEEHLIEKQRSQNQKLKDQIKQLSSAIEQTLAKRKKANYDRRRVPQKFSDNQVVASKERELQNAMNRVRQLKKDIAQLKEQLDSNVNEAKVTDLENQSKYLSGQVKELESEKSSLIKIQKEQVKALDHVNKTESYGPKARELAQNVRLAKEKYRELMTKNTQDEKIVRDQHEKWVGLEEKIRKLVNQIEECKAHAYDDEEPEAPNITKSDIDALKAQIDEVEKRKAFEEGKYRNRIRELESNSRNLKFDMEKLNLQIKEKEQESRLNSLKIKELRRAVRFNSVKPLTYSRTNSSQRRGEKLKFVDEPLGHPKSYDTSASNSKRLAQAIESPKQSHMSSLPSQSTRRTPEPENTPISYSPTSMAQSVEPPSPQKVQEPVYLKENFPKPEPPSQPTYFTEPVAQPEVKPPPPKQEEFIAPAPALGGAFSRPKFNFKL